MEKVLDSTISKEGLADSILDMKGTIIIDYLKKNATVYTVFLYQIVMI